MRRVAAENEFVSIRSPVSTRAGGRLEAVRARGSDAFFTSVRGARNAPALRAEVPAATV